MRGVVLQSVGEFGGDTDEVLMGYGHMEEAEARIATELLADACATIGGRSRKEP
jgi:GntR family transcriptional regulator/MocR family aminotransferase